MSPLRNAQPWWETAYTFEAAKNYVEDIGSEHELFTAEYEEDAAELWTLRNLADRQIIAAWTHKHVSRADEKKLREIADKCHLGLGIDGSPRVRTPHLDDLTGLNRPELEALGLKGLTWAMEDGLCEWILRGRTADVRACLWHGALFRADRANAVFDRSLCRTAYHRALNTANSSDKDPNALMGFFRCLECKRELLIDSASGIHRNEFGVITIGDVQSHKPICVSCAETNHPEWKDYIVPMTAAAA